MCRHRTPGRRPASGSHDCGAGCSAETCRPPQFPCCERSLHDGESVARPRCTRSISRSARAWSTSRAGQMPVQYAGIIEEHNAVRSGVGIFDVSHMGEFRFFGIGAKTALQRILTNDLDKIDAVGSALYTMMCDDDGGIIDDLIVYHSGDAEYLIVANASNRETDWDWITSHLPDGVEAVDESDRTALIAVQGPRGASVVAELAEDGWDAPQRFALAEATLGGVGGAGGANRLHRRGRRRAVLPRGPGRRGVADAAQLPRGDAVWSGCARHAASGDGLSALRQRHGPRGRSRSRRVWAGSCRRPRRASSGPRRSPRVREAGPANKLVGLTVSEGVPRHGYTVLHER